MDTCREFCNNTAAGDLRCLTAVHETVSANHASRKAKCEKIAPWAAACFTSCIAFRIRIRPSRRGDGGGVAVTSKKEAAAEEARVRALGFELWSKVRKLEDSWASDLPYARRAFPPASWDTRIGSSSSTQHENKKCRLREISGVPLLASRPHELPLPLPLCQDRLVGFSLSPKQNQWVALEERALLPC